MAETQQKKSYVIPMLVTVACLTISLLILNFTVFNPHAGRAQPIDQSPQPAGNDTASPAPAPEPAEAVSLAPITTLDARGAGAPPANLAEVSAGYDRARFLPVKNGTYTAVFCDRGAVLVLLRFINDQGQVVYTRTQDSPMEDAVHPLQLLGRQLGDAGADLKPEEFVPGSPEFTNYWSVARPNTFGFIGGEAWRNGVLWSTTGFETSGAAKTIAFTSPPDANGVAVTKRFTIHEQFKITCDIELSNPTQADITPDLSFYGPVGIRRFLQDHAEAGIVSLYEAAGGVRFEEYSKPFQTIKGELEAWLNERRQQGADIRADGIPLGKLVEPDPDQQVVLAGISNGYFIAALGIEHLPDWRGRVAGADLLLIDPFIEAGEHNVAMTYNLPPRAIKPGETYTRRLALYAGPRDRAEVNAAFETANPAAETADERGNRMAWSELVTTGWPTIISAPITALLRWLRDVLGSTGLAIIALTIIVRFLMGPLSIKGQRSMLIHASKTRKIKPKLDAIKAKYKEQKSREAQMLQFQELRAVMKANGVPMVPLGGCLPLLLQFPIFIALYNSVRNSFLLHHQEFLWIRDLSRPDALVGAFDMSVPLLSAHGWLTFNLLPLIWVIFMVVQQRGQPKATDPQQAQMQKMMTWITPLFGLFFYALPAGFVLYFVISIVYSFVETRAVKYWLISRGVIGDPHKEAAEAAAAADVKAG